MKRFFKPAIELMNRLKYPQKFALISMLFALPLALVMTLLIFKISHDSNFSQKELDGNAYLRPTRALLEHALENRLLAYTAVRNSGSFNDDLLRNQAQIDTDFQNIALVDRRFGKELNTTQRFTALRASWQDIKEKTPELDSATSDTLRTTLIHDIRALITHVGNTSNLILDPDLDSYYLMDSVLLKLPEGQDLLAQTLFAGERALESKQVSADERARLIVLGGLVQSNVEAMQQGMMIAFQNNPAQDVQPALEQPLRASVDQTNAFLATLNSLISTAPAITFPPDAYRTAAMQALDSKFALWDSSVARLDILLENRIDEFTRQKYLAVTVTGFGLVLVMYLWVAFYLSVMRTVSRLDKAARRMVSGNITESVRLDTQDELGQVAESFNQVANALLNASIQRQALVDNAVDGILTIDMHDRIASFNPAAERMFGYRADEVIGQPVKLLIMEPYHSQYKLISIGREIPARRKDGTIFPMDLAAGQMQVGSQRLYIGIARDVTKRKQEKEELQRAKEMAEAASRAKSEFLANMSHEIRTPMNAIIGMTGLLLDTELTTEQRDFAETVRHSGDTLLTIINDILDFSKIEAGRLELEQQPFDLRDCLESALDLLANRASEKGLDLAYLTDTQVPAMLVGDVTRLRQILVNLLSNAVKFTAHGEVVITVSDEMHAPSDEGDAADTQDERRDTPHLHLLHFAIKDTGIGIPPDRMDRLFRSFSQIDASTTRRYGGTGLGLAISKRLSELMGGTMWVESEVGKGSTFHFTILAEAAAGIPQVYLRDEQPQLQSKRLLIVDDNATNRQILTRQAHSWGMLPVACENGTEALNLIRRGEPFDIGILDMQMPEMDGLTLAAEIRRYRDHRMLPLVMLTSLGRKEADVRIAEFAAFLTKPIKPSQLYNVLAGVFIVQPIRVREPNVVSTIDGQMGERLPLRLLLAEDNAVNQKLAVLILERMGYRADVAANGIEALEALERQTYDAILMDVQMPEMDGLEATERICRQWPEEQRPYIIAMTANAMQGDRELCLQAGMNDYVTKPIQVKELQAALERADLHRGQYREQPAQTSQDKPAFDEQPAPIDWSVLEDLRQLQSPDEPDVVATLIGLFAEEAPPLIAQMHEALVENNGDKLKRAAHSLKSSSGSLGAHGLAALCADLEKRGRTGALEGSEAVLEELEQAFERVCQALELA